MTDTGTNRAARTSAGARARTCCRPRRASSKQGRKPSLEEIAEEALVSRATAYRYFPSVEALIVEASLDVAVPDADELFRGELATIRSRAWNASRPRCTT